MIYRFLKRLIDVFVSLALIVLLSPFLILTMILLKVTGDGDIFFTQKRYGLHNKLFKIWKFATMFKGSEHKGTKTITLRDDPRVTPIGSFLRKTKLNELPQLINVLLGEMSLVGPRPQGKFEFEAYPEYVQKHIYDCTPGITGIASIIFRDEEKFFNNSDMDAKSFYLDVIAPYKGEVELWYRNHQTIFVDLKIMILTAWVIVFPNDDKIIFSVFPSLPKFEPQLSGVNF